MRKCDTIRVTQRDVMQNKTQHNTSQRKAIEHNEQAVQRNVYKTIQS